MDEHEASGTVLRASPGSFQIPSKIRKNIFHWDGEKRRKPSEKKTGRGESPWMFAQSTHVRSPVPLILLPFQTLDFFCLGHIYFFVIFNLSSLFRVAYWLKCPLGITSIGTRADQQLAPELGRVSKYLRSCCPFGRLSSYFLRSLYSPYFFFPSSPLREKGTFLLVDSGVFLYFFPRLGNPETN